MALCVLCLRTSPGQMSFGVGLCHVSWSSQRLKFLFVNAFQCCCADQTYSIDKKNTHCLYADALEGLEGACRFDPDMSTSPSAD